MELNGSGQAGEIDCMVQSAGMFIIGSPVGPDSDRRNSKREFGDSRGMEMIEGTVGHDVDNRGGQTDGIIKLTNRTSGRLLGQRLLTRE